MQNNQININIKDDKVKLSTRKAMPLPDFLQVMQTGILTALQTFVNRADDKEKARSELYDLYNIAASNTLHYFAPEYDLHPDLTAEAILKAENEIIDAKYKEMKKNAKKKI